ncbi:MAG: MFS transporter [Microbacterium sp.]|jgi:MFS family permease|nr:MFS transporter [Microbacterium sp.]HBR87808.1 MFS transporter [Microbacterium sp.]HBS74456.1 MFS transporter [Microbacterium sp.]|tara:strand:- start:244 stop:1500 length:1257 start_codon:yes stop_codon:yes gene_type:complete
MVGTSLESFDFYVFAYFSAFFLGPLFFSPLGEFGSTLTSFLTIALAFVVRPIGAVLFGYMGDRLGRRATLLWTIGIMGVATGLIGMLPTYAQAGWLGAALLIALRIAQGLSLGGEWGGSILIATEHSSPVRRAFFAAIPQLGSPVGSILSATVYIVMTQVLSAEDLAAWGWRIPFLLAIPLLAVSLYLRLTITETPVFRDVVAEGRRDRVPFVTMFARRPLAIVVAIGAALLGIGSYSLMNTYTVNYGVAQLGFAYQDLLVATTIGGLLQLVTIPLFGWWSTRIGSARVVMWGALGTLLITFPMYFLLQFATFPILVGTMIIGGILPTMAWAALGGLMNDLFPDHFRYSALSLSYAIAATVSGFVPALTLALGEATAYAWWHPGIVLAIMSAITLLAAWVAARMPTAAHVAAPEPVQV